MNGYDEKVPQSLRETQDWFANIITMPIDDNSRMSETSPSGNAMVEEAKQYILPSPTLKADQRIQIYNQQYWWRLLGVLHDNYPLTVRLFGYRDFNNNIGTPYLVQHPPAHWSLNHLGDTLPEWVQSTYQGDDKMLVCEAIELDWAFNDSFFAAEYPFTDLQMNSKESNETILKEKIFLQPHLHLFAFKHNLLPFRGAMLEKEPEHWIEHPFPQLQKDKMYYFVVYRNTHMNVVWQEIDVFEYKLLELFKEGTSIEKVCQWLEKQDQTFLQTAAENLHLWFQEWTLRQWLCNQKLPDCKQREECVIIADHNSTVSPS